MRTENTYLKIILLLALLGILTSGWLLSVHIRFATGQAGLTEGCLLPSLGGSQGCANVAVSKYSDLGGVPLASLALGFYFTLVLLVFWAMRNFQAAYEALYVSYFLSTISIVVTVIMFFISRYVLNSFCLGCAILWLVNLLIWPSFVKHLGLSWSNALVANLELLRAKKVNLRKDRISYSFAVGAGCVLVFALLGVVAKSLQNNENRTESSSILASFQEAPQIFLPPESVGGPTSKGAETPIMDIVEFADFQCPGCRMAGQFLKPFVMKNSEKVRVTFRNFPLDGSCNSFVPNGQHRMACAAAKAAICASEEGKFWEMHDLLFDNQENFSAVLFEEFAKKIGLDETKFSDCLSDPKTETQIQKEINWGEQIQLSSTPTIVINGRRLTGARSPQDLELLLKKLEKDSAHR